jgi:ADP-ribose pyrophosphatase
MFILKGLVDDGETPEDAAIRELEEETGFKANQVVETSPLIVSDPGQWRYTVSTL